MLPCCPHSLQPPSPSYRFCAIPTCLDWTWPYRHHRRTRRAVARLRVSRRATSHSPTTPARGRHAPRTRTRTQHCTARTVGALVARLRRGNACVVSTRVVGYRPLLRASRLSTRRFPAEQSTRFTLPAAARATWNVYSPLTRLGTADSSAAPAKRKPTTAPFHLPPVGEFCFSRACRFCGSFARSLYARATC